MMRITLLTTMAGPTLTAQAGDTVEVTDEMAEELKAGGYAKDPKPVAAGRSDAAFMAAITGKPVDLLKKDGPTVAEFVKAGYLAKNYPPSGYASKSTAEEIADAIKADEAAATAKARSPESVKAALDKLDPANDEDWTAAGLPAMGRIEALTGTKEITRAEVTAMFPEFKRPDPAAGKGNDAGGDNGGATNAGGGRSGPRTNNR